MSVHWEVEYQRMELHGPEVTWTLKNVGDETAMRGTDCGEISIWQQPDPQGLQHIDSTPWTTRLTLDGDVEPGTGHPMRHLVEWSGQNHGTYTAQITVGEGVTTEIYFQATQDGIVPVYR